MFKKSAATESTSQSTLDTSNDMPMPIGVALADAVVGESAHQQVDDAGDDAARMQDATSRAAAQQSAAQAAGAPLRVEMRPIVPREEEHSNGAPKANAGDRNGLAEDAVIKMETRGLKLSYGPKLALKEITARLPLKSITALIGPSGCGKSTFLRCLNRMNDLIEGVKITGDVSLDEENIYARGVDVVELRQRVGMVFQKPNPFPMSIFDNIAYGPRLHGVKNKTQLREIVEQSLQRAALWDEVKDDMKKSALALSGGQQQRLCIARSLATQPEVLLMDEPASALDPISTLKIEELMRELKEQYTIVIVTHNMQQAARVSDRTGFFLLGELIEMDTTSKIFTDPGDKRTEDYITGRFG